MLPRPTPASGLNKSLLQEKAKSGVGVGAAAAVTSAPVPATSIPMGRMTALQASSSAEEAVHSDASEASETSDLSKTSAAKSQAQQTRTLRLVPRTDFISKVALTICKLIGSTCTTLFIAQLDAASFQK